MDNLQLGKYKKIFLDEWYLMDFYFIDNLINTVKNTEICLVGDKYQQCNFKFKRNDYSVIENLIPSDNK